tara:strand:+ start:1329 stop:1994 length:666 start_codon:yes stop_codon:yes gene_type:complete
MWLKKCLVFDTISKGFDIPFDVGEKILKYLASQEKKNSHMMISELKCNIDTFKYYKQNIVDEAVLFSDVFYDGKDRSREFCESFLCRQNGIDIYMLLKHDDGLGSAILNSGRRIYNLNIGRFLTLSRCRLDLANLQMKTAVVGEIPLCDISSIDISVSEFYEYVDPPIRAACARMNLKNKREQFYKHTDYIDKTVLPNIVEEEAEYYIYLMNSSLLKDLLL